jgi:hypothetical protein
MEKVVKFPFGFAWYRYRYIDWEIGTYSPWTAFRRTEDNKENMEILNKVLEDASIDSVEFRMV